MAARGSFPRRFVFWARMPRAKALHYSPHAPANPRHLHRSSKALCSIQIQSWFGRRGSSRRNRAAAHASHPGDSGTRAELEPLRRKIEHGHPFMTENGGGLFMPDGYFAKHLEGAVRAGAVFLCGLWPSLCRGRCGGRGACRGERGEHCRLFANDRARHLAQYRRIRAPGGAGTAARIQRALLLRGRLGGVLARFEREARERGWDAVRGEPFWELRSGNDEARALRHLMRLLRDSLHTRLRAVAIGSSARDLPLLSAADHAIVLPQRSGESRPVLSSRLPKAIQDEAPGPAGWNQAVLKLSKRRDHGSAVGVGTPLPGQR